MKERWERHEIPSHTWEIDINQVYKVVYQHRMIHIYAITYELESYVQIWVFHTDEEAKIRHKDLRSKIKLIQLKHRK